MNLDLNIIQANYKIIICDVFDFMGGLTRDEIAEVHNVSSENLYMPFIIDKNIKVVKYYKTIEAIGDPIDINKNNTLYLKYEIKPLETDIISIYTTPRYSNGKRFMQVSGLDIDATYSCYKPLLPYCPVVIYAKIPNIHCRPSLTYECYLLSDYRKNIIHSIL